MNKEDIITFVAGQARIVKKDAAEAVNAVFECIAQALEKGEAVKVAGFGTFEVKAHKARKGMNPVTREKIEIPAMKAISFRAAKQAKDRVNQ